MKHNQLMNLCNALQLGTPLAEAKRIYGGLLHQMWRINTDEASYAVKQLSHDIVTINTAYQHTLPLLKRKCIVSHGDLDKKNVLWDHSDAPILIDWECTRKLNPTHEIVNACLDWSGITMQFNRITPELLP